jgi:hypothetical protein
MSAPTSFPNIPRVALLPGRSQWLTLHCDRLVNCTECLHAIAAFLADELKYNPRAALNRSAESYQADLGVHCCTIEQARTLRRLTTLSCFAGEDIQLSEFIIADEARLLPAEAPRA